MTEKEFISGLTSGLNQKGIKVFPVEFINPKNAKQIKAPGKTLIPGEQFFGSYEVITTDGTLFYQANSHYEAKYIVYANLNNPQFINIPDNEADIKSAVTKYESCLDSIIKIIETEYRKTFPEGKNSTQIVNNVFRLLNLVRY